MSRFQHFGETGYLPVLNVFKILELDLRPHELAQDKSLSLLLVENRFLILQIIDKYMS